MSPHAAFKPGYRHLLFYGTAAVLLFFILSFRVQEPAGMRFPFRKAGLDARQAAAVLIDKFTYGSRPGSLDEVLQTGHEQWFMQQLEGRLPDTALDRRLSGFDALHLSNADVLRQFPRPPAVRKEMEREGIIRVGDSGTADRAENRAQYREFLRKKGYRLPRELQRQHISRKILAAVYSNNQLHQLLTDFWFNHFNVSITKNACAEYVPAYERDVIRPHVAGRFHDLLLATAQSPAMLLYLDNFSSMASMDSSLLLRNRMRVQPATRNADTTAGNKNVVAEAFPNRLKNRGLNENYAREIMELHTLGVDGGYTQQDVTQAARILTGWTLYPLTENGAIRRLIDRIGMERLEQQGFVRNGDFLFAATFHDSKEKKVLGKGFPAGGGYEEGLELLRLLAEHPSTAKHICRKLAIRFVSDNPPAALVDAMANAFASSGGDIASALKAMVSSVEFWTEAAKNQKTKSPFELAVSAVRSLNADIRSADDLNRWITKMGQPLYAYQAPTGYPDRGQFWINSGSIINRMNFGLALASGKIADVQFDLPGLNRNHEPESTAEALRVYSGLLLPGRKSEANMRRLTPLLNTPGWDQKVAAAAAKTVGQNTGPETGLPGLDDDEELHGNEVTKATAHSTASINDGALTLAQVAGIILGSPEFQRR